jgi:hypothetical protein
MPLPVAGGQEVAGAVADGMEYSSSFCVPVPSSPNRQLKIVMLFGIEIWLERVLHILADILRFTFHLLRSNDLRCSAYRRSSMRSTVVWN